MNEIKTEPMSTLDFRLMSLAFGFRDFIRPL